MMTDWVYGEIQDYFCVIKSSKLTYVSLQDILTVVFTKCPLIQTQFDTLVSPCKILFYMRSQRVHNNTEKINILSKVIEIPFQIHSLTSIYIHLHL